MQTMMLMNFLISLILSGKLLPDMQKKIENNGMYFHGVFKVHKAEEFVTHWKENNFYLDCSSFVNSLTPKVAGSVGILIDPTHQQVTSHMIASGNAQFKGFKGTPIGKQERACSERADEQFSDEISIVGKAMRLSNKFQYANDCYEGKVRIPQKGWINSENIIQLLKQNQATVSETDWSEIVLSAPFSAVEGVVFWTHTGSSEKDRASELCKAMRAQLSGTPCFITKEIEGQWKLVEMENETTRTELRIDDVILEIEEEKEENERANVSPDNKRNALNINNLGELFSNNAMIFLVIVVIVAFAAALAAMHQWRKAPKYKDEDLDVIEENENDEGIDVHSRSLSLQLSRSSMRKRQSQLSRSFEYE